MARAYLRLDPAFFERKALDQKYPAGAVVALAGAFCNGEHQPQRGRFRNERVLRALLGPYAKWIPYLIAKRDLVRVGEQLYVDGWDEWQEGDWKVGERVRRIRGRRKASPANPPVTPDVTVDVTPDVTVANESGDSVTTVYNMLESVIDGAGGADSPQPPASGGRPSRSNGTSPRALAKAEAARVERDAKAKRWRRTQRQLAYARGAITEAQQADMDARDAELDEIPDWLAHLASLQTDLADGPTWLLIGRGVADGGALVLLISLILSGIAVRRSKPGLATAAGILSAILLVAFLVAVWAMGAKPS
jgi:hypothetical protein